MSTFLRFICITILLLCGLPGVVQGLPANEGELLLELGVMTADTAPTRDQPVLMLELDMLQEGHDWLEQWQIDATQPGGQLGAGGALLLELSPLSVPEGLGRDPAVTEAFLAAYPGVLLLDFSAIPGALTDEELAALAQQRPGLLVLELDQTFNPDLDRGDGYGGALAPGTLVLELASTAEDMTPLTPNTLLLQLEAIQGGPALRPMSDFMSQLLAFYAPSLIGHWRLTEGEGYNVWDYSDYENNGTLSGNYAWTSDGLQLNGGYMTVPYDDSLDVDNGFTMAAWISLDDVSGTQEILGKLAPDGENTSGFRLQVLDGQLCPIIWDTLEGDYADCWGSVPANTWTHLAVTWESGGDQIGYVNGAEVGRIRASDQSISANTAPLIIGVDPEDLNSNPVKGVVADVRLYEVPLPITAISLLMIGWGDEAEIAANLSSVVGSTEPGGAKPGGAEPGGAGGLDFLGNAEFTESYMITESVINNLFAEEIDPAIVHALTTLQGIQFTDTANNQHCLLQAAGDALFTKFKTFFKPGMPDGGPFKITDDVLQSLPQELRSTVQKLKEKTYDNEEQFTDAVKAKLQDAVKEKLVQHAEVQQRYKIDDAVADNNQALQGLKGKLYLSEDDFRKAVRGALNDENADMKELEKQARVEQEYRISPEMVTRLEGKEWNHLIEKQQNHYILVSSHLDDDDPRVTEAYDKLQRLKKKDLTQLSETDLDEDDKLRLQKIRNLENQTFIKQQNLENALKDAIRETDFKRLGKQLEQDARQDTFGLTSGVVTQLKQAGVSKETRKKLKKKFKGRRYEKLDNFQQALSAEIGDNDRQAFEKVTADALKKQASVKQTKFRRRRFIKRRGSRRRR